MKKHQWKNGDTCTVCGLHREGAGAGPYGAMRYYRDGDTERQLKAGPCGTLGTSGMVAFVQRQADLAGLNAEAYAVPGGVAMRKRVPPQPIEITSNFFGPPKPGESWRK